MAVRHTGRGKTGSVNGMPVGQNVNRNRSSSRKDRISSFVTHQRKIHLNRMDPERNSASPFILALARTVSLCNGVVGGPSNNQRRRRGRWWRGRWWVQLHVENSSQGIIVMLQLNHQDTVTSLSTSPWLQLHPPRYVSTKTRANKRYVCREFLPTDGESCDCNKRFYLTWR